MYIALGYVTDQIPLSQRRDLRPHFGSIDSSSPGAQQLIRTGTGLTVILNTPIPIRVFASTMPSLVFSGAHVVRSGRQGSRRLGMGCRADFWRRQRRSGQDLGR